jgi:hypothetical protein
MDTKDGEIQTDSGGPSRGRLYVVRALAWVSLVCGAGSLVVCVLMFFNLQLRFIPRGFFFLDYLPLAVPLAAGGAVVTGHSARLLAWRGGCDPATKRAAGYGLLFADGLFLLCCLVFAYSTLPILQHRRVPRKTCQENLKEHGLVQWMWVNELKDRSFPALFPEPGRLCYAREYIEEYLTDFSTMYCPEDKETVEALREVTDRDILLDDHSYFYLSHAVLNDREMAAFSDAYRKAVALGPKALNEDFVVPAGSGNNGGDRLLRLRGNMGPLLAGAGDPGTDKNGQQVLSRVPVLIERLGNHKKPGGHVQYLDRHVEFVPYPGPFPMTKETVALLESLDAMGPPPIGKTRAVP